MTKQPESFALKEEMGAISSKSKRRLCEDLTKISMCRLAIDRISSMFATVHFRG